MKKKLTFDPAVVIFFLVASTLLTLSFLNDEHTRNLLAGVILATSFVLFFGALVVRTLKMGSVKH